MSEIASPGPIDPNSGQPDHHAEVSALKAWLRQNAVSLAVCAVVVALICVYLDPVDTLKVVFGLGLIIFIHELGHFLAAKWCDVHVKTFSIGFGPAVPFCSYKWGETTYMVGVIPLGGYVSMVGEGTGESTPDGDPDDDDSDPRSFKNKRVGQRMLIISAGVIMNLILGMGCFMAAYLHGVREMPAAAGRVDSGSAAWRAGIRTGDDILEIGGREKPFFNDIRPIVMSTLKNEQVTVVVRHADGREQTVKVAPLRDEEMPYPVLGIAPPYSLTLVETRKRSISPVVPGSPATAAKDPAFQPGDRVVGMTDPASPTGEVTPLPREPVPGDPGKTAPDYNAYYRRVVDLAEKEVTFHVLRKGQPDDAAPTAIKVAPALRTDLGVRMQMGKVVAVRAGGPADKKVNPVPLDGPEAAGDLIAAVGVIGPDGKRTWLANSEPGKRPAEAKPDDAVRPLDPMLLPQELQRWAAEFPPEKRKDLKVDLVVLREVDHAQKRQTLTLDYDDSYRYDREGLGLGNSPLPVGGLGLAYWVQGVVVDVEPKSAADEKLKAGDQVTAVRLHEDGAADAGAWKEIKPHQWAATETLIQRTAPARVELRVKRGDETKEVTLDRREDKNWGLPDRGLVFEYDFRTQKADDVVGAVKLGARRTVRFIVEVYQSLYGMIVGRISPKTLSGPLTIATVSYRIAGEDVWQFLLFLGLISVNLAVVNFLPIPVLDGGHMVFLIIEKVLGRPVPERLFAAAMWVGLFLILLLFVFVITRDIGRLFFGWI